MSTVDLLLVFTLFSCSLIPNTNSLGKKDGPCEVENFCQCKFLSGATIDLSKIKLNLLQQVVDNETKVIYNPCSNIVILDPLLSDEANGCAHGSSFCLISNNSSKVKFVNLGLAEDVQFSSTNQKEPVTVTYQKEGWVTQITINCKNELIANDSLSSPVFLKSSKTLSFQLNSSAVCVDFNPSTPYGFLSILLYCIIFGFFLYFIGGAILLKFLRGAEGIEMIPNHSFWCNLPQRIREAVTYCLNQGQKVTTYETI